MKANGVEILLNILFWLASAWIITSGFSIQAQEIELINGVETTKIFRSETMIIKILICIGISLLLFYANLWNLARVDNQTRKGRIFLNALLFLIIAITSSYLLGNLNLAGSRLPLPASLSFGIIGFYFTVSTAYGLGKMWLAAEQKQREFSLAKKQAELNLLRNQLQPHFLFNALNNLLSMVDQQRSPQLANSFERLSQLLRYVIDETRSDQVSVSQEIEFIRNYSALQLLRFEADEVDFKLNIIGSFDNQAIEPGLFIPFVENAFKYGTEPEHKAEIELNFDLSQEKEIYFFIKNSIFNAFHQSDSPGTGIKTTQERLNLVYPDKHLLTITSDKYFIVELKIQTA